MFDKFGEFDSADEMNRAAAAQRKEGDNEAILAIAEENGIDKEDAMDFIDGCVAAFVTPLMAAYGKLDIEAKELNPYEIMAVSYTHLDVYKRQVHKYFIKRTGE